MKKLLTLSVAGSALIAAGCTTAAMANDDIAIHENIEVIVHNQHDDGQSVIINGVNIEIVDGDVIINGDAIETTADGLVIISGDHANVIHSDDHHRNSAVWISNDEHTMRMAEVEASLEHLDNLQIVIDEVHSQEMANALAVVEREMGELRGRRMVIINGEERELTDEEREEIRVTLAETRLELSESMRDVDIDMHEVHGDREEMLRVMRIELQNAEQDLDEAQLEVRRTHRIVRNNQEMQEGIALELRERGIHRLRLVTEDNDTRVWVDGEELEGEARIDWLNRLEIERLEGGGDSSSHIVIEIEDDDE